MQETSDFKYEMEDVECRFCTFYKKKKGGCTHKGCPWLSERLEVGAVGYEETVLQLFPDAPRLEPKLRRAIQQFHGSLWLDENHKQRMAWFQARDGNRSRHNAPAYYAAMYLLTSNAEIAGRISNCFRQNEIEFSFALTKGISTHNYTLLSAAKDIYANGDSIALTDLADGDIIDSTAFCLIVNALLIARYGCAALDIQCRQSKPVSQKESST